MITLKNKLVKFLPLILLLLLITIGLYILVQQQNSNQEPTIIEKEDTNRIVLVKNLFELRNQLEKIETKDSLMHSLLIEKKMAIDSLIDRTLDFKENKISLVLITKKYEKTKIEKDVLHNKVDSIHQQYVKLYGENYKLNEELNQERFINSDLKNENKNLKTKVTKASSVIITGAKVTGVGLTGNMFSKSKEYETNKSSKIKGFKFSCSLPANELAKKEEKTITFMMFSINNDVYIKKDTSLFYNGEESLINCTIKAPKATESGNHKVIILLNGVQQNVFNYKIID